MSDKFEWTEDVIAMPHVDRTAVYANEGGGITIRQEGGPCDPDILVVIPVEFADDVASMILGVAGQIRRANEEADL